MRLSTIRGRFRAIALALADVDPIAVRVGQDEGALAIILVRQPFDDPRTLRLAMGIERGRVADEDVHDVDRGGPVVRLATEMDFRVAVLQHHEADRIAIPEDAPEAEHMDVEVMGLPNVANRDARCRAAESDTVKR